MLKSGGKRWQGGFTIVELMIALSVLSTILVMATFIMIQISSLYSKGVNSANLQNTNRNVLGDMAASLQLSGNQPEACGLRAQQSGPCLSDANDTNSSHKNPTNYDFNGSQVAIYAYCIGTDRYTYVLNREQGTDFDGAKTPHVLWKDTITAAGACWPLDISRDNVKNDDATSLPGAANQGFNLLPDHMRLTVLKVAETPVDSGLYTLESSMAFGDSDLFSNGSATNCKGGAGQQFCATSQLKISVTRRIKVN